MPALSQSRFLRLLTFSALYLAQGVPTGFITVGYVVFLTDQGLNNEAIGSAIGLMSIPWTFKILWALLLDRTALTRFGRRRPFIIGAELAMGASLLLLLFFDPKRDLSLISAALVLHSTFAALQDAAVDALAIDLLPAHELGTANGLMWAAKTVGVGIGGGGGVVVAKHLGWSALILMITAVLWAVMLLVILLRERPRDDDASARRTPRLTLAELRRSFAFGPPLIGVALAMLTPLGFLLVSVVYVRTLRADLNLSAEAIATIQGVEIVAGIVGAVGGGLLADRVGVRKLMGTMMACIGASAALFALAPGLRSSFTLLVIWACASQIFLGAYNTTLISLMMRLSNPAVGATQISIFMGSVNLTAAWAAPVGGRIADAYGVSATFAVAAVAQILFIGLLPLCDPRAAEARFRPRPAAPEPSGLLGEGSHV
jgi:PAT family beta-lactamase induction signal transducer AmpG